MDTSARAVFPIAEWAEAMGIALARVRDLGSRTLATHRKASAEAEQIAQDWKLADHVEREHAAIEEIFDAGHRILDGLEATRRTLFEAEVGEQDRIGIVQQCTETIEDCLPTFERAFLDVRHGALDLLRFTRRVGHVEGSDLPDQYRSCFGALISYAPAFRPRIDAMKDELLARSKRPEARGDYRALLSALTRYHSAVETARSFVSSVAEPPLELVFEDTDLFHADWDDRGTQVRGPVVTELNDTCQFLLYDEEEFHRRVRDLKLQVNQELEASLYVLESHELSVIFSVDEDPLFGRLTVTLYRAVDATDLEQATKTLVATLYQGLADD